MFRHFARLSLTITACLTNCAVSAEPLDCLIVPRQIADLAFGTNGVVERLLVDRGDRVKKGDVNGHLNAAVEEANLAIAKARLGEVSAVKTAQAQLTAAKSKFQRNESLRDKRVVAASKFEEAEVEHESARMKVVEQEEALRLKHLDVQRAEATLRLRRIASPFDGVVVDRHVAPGEYVENKKALTIAQIDPVYADVIAPAAMFSAARKGQKIRIQLQHPVALEVLGEAAVIDPYVDGASGTFRIRVAIPQILCGMVVAILQGSQPRRH